jgi:hypothetical protein
MLRVSVLDKTLFFLLLVADPPKFGHSQQFLKEFAGPLVSELSSQRNNAVMMRSVLKALIGRLGIRTVAEHLGDEQASAAMYLADCGRVEQALAERLGSQGT